MEHLLEKHLRLDEGKSQWKSYKMPGRARTPKDAYSEMDASGSDKYDVYEWYMMHLGDMLEEGSKDVNDIMDMLHAPHVEGYLEITDRVGWGKADFVRQLKNAQSLGKQFAQALDRLQDSYIKSSE